MEAENEAALARSREAQAQLQTTEIQARPSQPPPHPETLAGRIAQVMGAISRVKKRGYNAFHQYHYATEGDILDEVRAEMAARGLVLIPNIVKVERRDVKNSEKAGPVTTVAMKYRLIASGLEDFIEIDWLGEGQDPGDKGLYKALTGAEKYVISKLFLVSTGDDPEAAAGGQQRPQQQQSGGRPEKPPPPPTPAQKIEAALKRYGYKNLKEGGTVVKKATGKATSKALVEDDVAEVEYELAVQAFASAKTEKELSAAAATAKPGVVSELSDEAQAELNAKYSQRLAELKAAK